MICTGLWLPAYHCEYHLPLLTTQLQNNESSGCCYFILMFMFIHVGIYIKYWVIIILDVHELLYLGVNMGMQAVGHRFL